MQVVMSENGENNEKHKRGYLCFYLNRLLSNNRTFSIRISTKLFGSAFSALSFKFNAVKLSECRRSRGGI